ncbi:MAG TPA: hypothetical protein VMU38_04715 [Candidatus Binatia bacterium]|nr:hypothetical protein [Candidatus Binatia bacterium]
MRTYVASLAFVALLAACAGSRPFAVTPPGSSVDASASRPQTISTKDLFVVFQYGSTGFALILQNGTFKYVGEINGLGLPYGSWVDSHGLYIASYSRYPDIVEFSSPSKAPFSYTAHVSYPLAVTTDSSGNVYETDNSGWINEYAQRKDATKKRCAVTYPVGVAVDGAGHVFVTLDSTGASQIVEFTDFSTCSSQTLGVKLRRGEEMALDKSDNIIVCDADARTVDIIKPPYKSVSGHLGSGFKGPVDVTINSANNRVWIVDATAKIVYDLYYPSGKLVAKLAFTAGTPISAVDGSNYVP